MENFDFLKLQQAEFLKNIEKKIEKELENTMHKNCKCNKCVWAYKEMHYCPLGRCIQGNR